MRDQEGCKNFQLRLFFEFVVKSIYSDYHDIHNEPIDIYNLIEYFENMSNLPSPPLFSILKNNNRVLFSNVESDLADKLWRSWFLYTNLFEDLI